MAIRVSLQLYFVVTRQTDANGFTTCPFGVNSIIEMHTFLVTLVRHFDFSLPENGQKIRLMRSSTITPLVVGEEDKGLQMPLMVTVLGNE